MVSARTKMLGSDLWRLRGQVIAAALVVACGIAAGTYRPSPVRRVTIPKPDGGGERELGIPTVIS